MAYVDFLQNTLIIITIQNCFIVSVGHYITMSGWIGWFWSFSTKHINDAGQKNKIQTADALFLKERYEEAYDTLIKETKVCIVLIVFEAAVF